MTAVQGRRGPTQAQREKAEGKALRIKAKIQEIESVLRNRDHPVLEPYLKQMDTRLKVIERELDDPDEKTEIQIRLLLKERVVIRNLMAFDDMEAALPRLREAAERYKKEAESGKNEF